VESLQELAVKTLRREPKGQILEFEGRWYTWGELQNVAAGMRRLLHHSGIVPNAPACLISHNHPAIVAALLGLIAEGRNVRMVYPFQAPAGIVRDIKRLEPAAFVLLAKDLSSEVAEALREEGIVTIVLTGMEVSAAPGLGKAGPAAAARVFSGEPRIEVLTSGTTGPPKQFAITYDTIRTHHVGGGLTRPKLEAGDELPPYLLYMPIGNISGIYTTLPAILNGQRAQLLERFSIRAWVDYVKMYRPETHDVPPSMMKHLLDADIPKDDLKFLVSMGSGAAPLDPAVQAAFEDKYGIPVLVSYGATEFGGPVVGMTLELHNAFGRSKLGTVGRKFPGCDVRIVDPQDGHVLAANEEGLLEVLAVRMQPEWIRTSDIGVIDKDGFLFLRGRADGAIMRGGFKVLPEVIERALLLHPAVAETAVVAVADQRVGQVPGAAIRLNPSVIAPTP
jgi:long-chain acyl-CoA synthetase